MTLTTSPSVAEELAARFRASDSDATVEVIRNIPFVSGDAVVSARLADVATIQPFNAGEVLIKQGDANSDLLLILVGAVAVAPNGRADTIRHAPAHVGELTTIDPSTTRAATVRAIEPTVVARISEIEFSRIARDFPDVWRQLAVELGRRLRKRTSSVPLRGETSRVFVASTSEALKMANALKAAFVSDPYDVHVWTDGIFTPGLTNIEALEQELLRADFAVLLLSPDDKVLSRWTWKRAPRDNLVLELGMFVGAIGRMRSLMVQPRGAKLKIPSDLLGVSPITYPAQDMLVAAGELRSIFNTLGPK